MGDSELAVTLLSRAGSLLAGIPIGVVSEVTRPLPLETIPHAPEFIDGIAIIRGIPTPVVRLRRLFAEPEAEPRRLIVVRLRERQLALAVDDVIDVRGFPKEGFGVLPQLLGSASREIISEVGTLDGELLVLLQTARIVPDALFATLEAKAR